MDVQRAKLWGKFLSKIPEKPKKPKRRVDVRKWPKRRKVHRKGISEAVFTDQQEREIFFRFFYHQTPPCKAKPLERHETWITLFLMVRTPHLKALAELIDTPVEKLEAVYKLYHGGEP